MSASLNPEKALVFRIVHRDNVPWILEHGLHCRNSPVQAPSYRTIGNPDIIDRREHRRSLFRRVEALPTMCLSTSHPGRR